MIYARRMYPSIENAINFELNVSINYIYIVKNFKWRKIKNLYIYWNGESIIIRININVKCFHIYFFSLFNTFCFIFQDKKIAKCY